MRLSLPTRSDYDRTQAAPPRSLSAQPATVGSVSDRRDQQTATERASAQNSRGAPGRRPRSTLDASQRAVLDLPDGASAAVIGAPGSGKTAHPGRIRRRSGAQPRLLAERGAGARAHPHRRHDAARPAGPATGGSDAAARSRAPRTPSPSRSCGTPIAAGGTSPTLLTGGEQDQIIAELLQGDIDEQTGPAWPQPARRRGAAPARLPHRAARPDDARRRIRRHRRRGWPTRPGRRTGRSGPPPPSSSAATQDMKDQSRPGQYDSTELCAVRRSRAASHDADQPARPAPSTLGAAGRRCA